CCSKGRERSRRRCSLARTTAVKKKAPVDFFGPLFFSTSRGAKARPSGGPVLLDIRTRDRLFLPTSAQNAAAVSCARALAGEADVYMAGQSTDACTLSATDFCPSYPFLS
ncbi:unnamed protein product, partial [Ectocarpus fasciculatus]